MEIPVQISGKLRKITVSPDVAENQAALEAAARADAKVAELLAAKPC